MKIKVSAIKPNPFRHIEKYPISREKVDALKASIEQTTFWDNILVRPVGDEYELAYGHHRLMAVKELGIEEVDVPVRDLDDPTMLRIMANENMDSWEANPAVIMETVAETKKYLEAKLADCKTDEDWSRCVSGDIPHRGVLANLRTKGIGAPTISDFLGSDLWPESKVKTALSILKATEEPEEGVEVEDLPPVVSSKAIQSFKNVSAANNFVKAVKEQKIEPEEQERLAEEINADGGASKREVTKAMEKRAIKNFNEKMTDPEWKKKWKEDVARNTSIGEYAKGAIDSLSRAYAKAEPIIPYLDHIPPVLRDQLNEVVDLIGKLKGIGTKEIENV